MRPMSETQLDEQYERAEKRAEELTEQNRAALQAKAQKDPELAKLAMTEYLDNIPLEDTAELLWNERSSELAYLNVNKMQWMIEKTPLARWFKAASAQYARDNAEKVRAQTLLDEENDTSESHLGDEE